MKLLIATIFFLFVPLIIYSQNYSHQSYVISNGGLLLSGEEYENSIITGEPIISYPNLNVEPYSAAFGFFPEPEDWVSAEDDDFIPSNFFIKQNYPNPFNIETTIYFNLPQKEKVSLEIFNIKGQKVNKLIDQEQNNGLHKVTWSGRDSFGRKVSSGIYFYRIISGKNKVIKKMILMQ